jgi:hypothetical protein
VLDLPAALRWSVAVCRLPGQQQPWLAYTRRGNMSEEISLRLQWDAPFVYDPDVNASANKRIRAHEPSGASPHNEDVDIRRIW